MRNLLALLLLAASSLMAHAAPFLVANPYTFDPKIPQTAYTFKATATPGPFSLTCAVDGARIPRCDAAAALAVAVPIITFTMSVQVAAGCDATGANCWSAAGPASSVPFVRTTTAPTVDAATGLHLEP